MATEHEQLDEVPFHNSREIIQVPKYRSNGSEDLPFREEKEIRGRSTSRASRECTQSEDTGSPNAPSDKMKRDQEDEEQSARDLAAEEHSKRPRQHSNPESWERQRLHRWSMRLALAKSIANARVIPERILDDLYRDHPEMQLDDNLNPVTLKLVARVVLQLMNEVLFRWCKKWCPDESFPEKLADIRVEGQEGELTSNEIVVPSEAADLGSTNTTIAEMYRECNRRIDGINWEVDFDAIMKLIDHCIAFMSVLKDTKCRDLVQETRSTFRLFPILVEAKKYPLRSQAQSSIDIVGELIMTSEYDSETRQREREYIELKILDEIQMDYNIERELLNIEMLNTIQLLLEETKPSSPIDDTPVVN
ncbi:hypothetical protein GGS21DRAFT_493385 [Xylaria nigripes]|nr:hypothetical protein GGS21DRAFT_493385 [Xylaria nigripes]